MAALKKVGQLVDVSVKKEALENMKFVFVGAEPHKEWKSGKRLGTIYHLIIAEDENQYKIDADGTVEQGLNVGKQIDVVDDLNEEKDFKILDELKVVPTSAKVRMSGMSNGGGYMSGLDIYGYVKTTKSEVDAHVNSK